MNDTKTTARTFEVPAEPEGLKKVTAADGKLWRNTNVLPNFANGRGHYWVDVADEIDKKETGSEVEPYRLSWHGLVSAEGPLTEVVD